MLSILKKRKDRKNHIFNEFIKHKNFEVVILEAVENIVPAVGLYLSLCNVIEKAQFEKLPYVLFCEDDHWVLRSVDASDFGQTVPLKRSYNYIKKL